MDRGFESHTFHQAYSEIAQSVERRTVNPQVPGSSPGFGAKQWGYSSAGRAVALQAKGHRFDPVYLHQIMLGWQSGPMQESAKL